MVQINIPGLTSKPNPNQAAKPIGSTPSAGKPSASLHLSNKQLMAVGLIVGGIILIAIAVMTW